MDEKNKSKLQIDIRQIVSTLWNKKKLFIKVWIITFALSCLWILPQPRYYTTEVSVAPESSESKGASGLSTIASNFGLNIGNGSSDAIYPQLYPDLFGSTEFLVGLLDVKVQTLDGEVDTDYYTYMTEHQKQNWLLLPLAVARNWVASLFPKDEVTPASKDGKRFDPFRLSRKTTELLMRIGNNIQCTYSRTTEVVTIKVTDQDPLVSALMADSVKAHLQAFVTEYRTKKARIDYEHYKKLAEDSWKAYEQSRQTYSTYADTHQDAFLQSVRTRMTDLENEMQLKYNIYSTMRSHEESAMADLQERTPAFTTLTNATVPIKPAGPKRMVFVAAMLFLATIGTIIKLFKKELVEWF